MTDETWDVVVVGAGPAGCAAAAGVLTERPTARVLLLDRSDFPRDKVCGDGIAAEAMDELASLGFDTARVAEGYSSMRRLRLRSPGGYAVDRPMEREVHVIPRAVFDGRLVAEVTARGAVLRRHSVKAIERRDDEVVLDGSIRTNLLIGADGAESVIRRSLGLTAGRPGRVALAIRGYAAEPTGQSGTQVITMTKGAWPAYAWSFPIGDGRANVGYGELLTRRPVSRTHLVAELHRLLPEVEGRPEDLRAHRLPLSNGRPHIGAGRVLLVGDAQSLINPMTGEGIYYAAVSGGLAGRAALAADPGTTYRRLLRRRLGRHFRHTAVLARLSRWTGLVDSGARAAEADQAVFDDLVRVGLSDGLLTGRVLVRLRPR